MSRRQHFGIRFDSGAASFPAARTRLVHVLAVVFLVTIFGRWAVEFSEAAPKPPVQAANAKPAPPPATEGTETPPPDPVEVLKQETQEKFDAQIKTLAELRDGIDKLGQDARVNAKTLQELKAKLEENAILVYEHLSRGLSGAEKLQQLSDRLDALEAALGIQGKHRAMAVEPSPEGKSPTASRPPERKPADSTPAPEAPGMATAPPETPKKSVQDAPANPSPACPEQAPCPGGPATAVKPPTPPLFTSLLEQRRQEPVRLLMAAVLVFIALPGFTLLELSQLETWAQPQAALRNLVVAAVVILAYFTSGHGVMFGEMVFGAPVPESGSGSPDAFRLYHLALALAATLVVATILSDRLSLPAYAFLALAFSGLAYPILGHWIWGGLRLPEPVGWLERRGFQDFAGATVIHSFAAWFTLGWIWRFPMTRFLDPSQKGTGATPRPNPALLPLGVFLVWLGWFGLAMGPLEGAPPPVALAILNTLLAGAGAMLTVLVYLLVPPRDGEAGSVFARISAGTVAGLVAISAGVDRVAPVEAIAIGALAGLLHPLAYQALTAKLIRRDQAAANLIAAHGISGAFGTLCAGLLGNPGTFTVPSPAQLGNQTVGILAALGLGLITGLFGALLYEGFAKLKILYFQA